MKFSAPFSVIALLTLAACQTPQVSPEPTPPPAPVTLPSSPTSRTPATRPSTPSATAPTSPTTTNPAPSVGSNSNSPAGSTGNASNVSAIDPRLAEGIASYEQGDFNAAIRKLNNKELLEGPSLDTQIDARKYLAFSYCITNRRALCRQQFDAALKAKPSFELKATEAGHPTWGPVFKQAKASLAGSSMLPSSSVPIKK